MRISLKGDRGMKVVIDGCTGAVSIRMLCMLDSKPDDIDGNMSYRMMSDGRCFCRSIVLIPNGFVYEVVSSAMNSEELMSHIRKWFSELTDKVVSARMVLESLK